jgi:hypothetical protein
VGVRGVVVDNGMDQLAGRDHALDGIKEADELLMPVALHATAEDDAIERVEGGKQGGRAVPFVIVGHRTAPADVPCNGVKPLGSALHHNCCRMQRSLKTSFASRWLVLARGAL